MAKAGKSVGQESDGGATTAWRVDAGLSVGSFMRTDVAYLRENMWVDAALSFLSERGLRDAPVLDDEGRPVGVMYVDDVETEDSFGADPERAGEGNESGVAGELERGYGLHRGFHLDGRRRLRVREVMVPYVPEISVEASIASAGLIMHDHQLDHVMVVGDDGRAVGTFSRDELVEWLVDQTSGEPALAGHVRCLKDIMRPLITVRRRASLLTARDLLSTHDLEELPVVEGARVVGVVCEADIHGIVSAHRDDDGWMQELLVEDIMQAPPLVRGPDEALDAVRPLLESTRGACVLVEQNGRVIGMVSARDLAPDAGGFHTPRPRPHLHY